ncbi:hypothetical protein Q0M94_22565 (plasmid) [Deinococcus radiomollis]|uniref:hypothetical protein n=1 Tax=Deinococcus radiomollis TaxID=468916 RepID=UPI0038920860
MEHVILANSFKERAELTLSDKMDALEHPARHTHRTTVSRLICIVGEYAEHLPAHYAQHLGVTDL